MSRLSISGLALLSAAILGAALAGVSRGQDAKAVAEMEKLHEALIQPGAVIALNEGQAALDRIDMWSLKPETLRAEQKLKLARLELHAALAAGNAARALKAASAMTSAGADPHESAEAEYVAAIAAGDAQKALKAHATIGKLGPPADEKLKSRRAHMYACMKDIGKPAPDVSIATSDGAKLSPAKRKGTALLIDFWSTKSAPSADGLAALKSIATDFAAEMMFEMIGVNSDDAADTEKAKKWVSANGARWKQCFEGKSSAAPITHGAFRISKPAARQVLVDGKGFVRASGTAAEPAFVYAVRCAVAEAKGQFEYISPKDPDGKPAYTEPVGETTGGRKQDEAREPGKDELPSNPDAANLLLRARAAMRAGMRNEAKKLFQEVIDKYPGTKEAKEAEEFMP